MYAHSLSKALHINCINFRKYIYGRRMADKLEKLNFVNFSSFDSDTWNFFKEKLILFHKYD